MTDEEKEAIDYFNTDVEYLEEGLKNPNYIGRFITIQDKEVKYLKTILNLIQKQEKVIQGLNKQADELVDDYEKQLQEKNEYIFRLESERDRWE